MDTLPTTDSDEPFDFGDADKVWEKFYPRLRSMVSQRVRSIRRPEASESEVALSALHCFIDGVRRGLYEDLLEQDGAWRLLKTIAIRKVNDARKRLRAGKRGGNVAIIGQSDVAEDTGPACGVDAIPIGSSNAEDKVEAEDFFNHLLQGLPDEKHRDVVLLKLQGASTATIAECLNTTVRTVQRMLNRIEGIWVSESGSTESLEVNEELS